MGRPPAGIADRVLDSVDEQVYVVDRDYRITYANRRFPDDPETDPRAYVGERCHAVTHGFEVPCSDLGYECPVEAAFADRPATVTHEHRDADGESAIVEIEGVPLHSEPDHVAMIRTDVTDRTAREAELQTFKKAVDEAGLAIFITDVDGTIEYVNPAFEEITGYPAREALGRTPRILNSGRLSESYYRRMWAAITDGRRWHEVVPNERRSGQLYYADQTIAPILENGEVDRFVAIQRDVTDRMERNRHLQLFNRVLRHNFRNTLNVIVGVADSLEADGDEHLTLLYLLREASAELGTLSEKAYEISRLLLRRQDQTCFENLDGTIEGLLGDFREDHPDVVIERRGRLTVPLHADPVFPRAIEELIENAIEHAQTPDHRIEVCTGVEDGTAWIGITDTGPGIPPHEYQVITGEAEITQIDHGSGLGLWLAYWIVRRSGGSMAFETETSPGTTVRIELPLDRTSARSAVGTQPASRPHRLGAVGADSEPGGR